MLAYRPDDVDAWVRAFVTGAAHLLDALEQEPREPVLLNHLGVLLYELCEAGAAADLFRAALAARPRSARTSASNLEQARQRARSQAPGCPACGATRTPACWPRAPAAPAGRARPVKEPDALAVHDREGRGGDAPGLPRAAARASSTR